MAKQWWIRKLICMEVDIEESRSYLNKSAWRAKDIRLYQVTTKKKRKRLFHDLPLPPTPVGSTQVNSALGSPGRVYYTHNRASISFLNLIACGSIFDAGILLSILMLQRWLSVDFFEDINIKLCRLLLYVPAKLHDIWQPIRYADGTVLWASLGVSSP